MAKYLKSALQLRATMLSKARLVSPSVEDLSSAVSSTLASGLFSSIITSLSRPGAKPTAPFVPGVSIVKKPRPDVSQRSSFVALTIAERSRKRVRSKNVLDCGLSPRRNSRRCQFGPDECPTRDRSSPGYVSSESNFVYIDSPSMAKNRSLHQPQSRRVETGSQRNLIQLTRAGTSRPIAHSRLRGVAFHFLRIATIVAIVWLIREQHRAFIFEQAAQDTAPVEIERLRKFFPNAATLAGEGVRQETTAVLDGDGQALGYFIQTSPQSDRIVGYSGPTNTLIAFDADSRVLGIDVLSSRDTPEHVADVLRDEFFMTALAGKTWDDVRSGAEVDAVSGATLTSLAILEGISFRLGGNKPSLKFPDAIDLQETVAFFPNADSLRPRNSSATLLDVYDSSEIMIGAVTRTSPTTDTIMGYQGPTDSIIAFDPQDRVVGLQVRKSYDNEPYVGYVREETYFLERFNGLTLQELAKIDINEMRVEGVSGATMTSMAVAEGLPKAAEAALAPPAETNRRFVVATRDVGTVLVLIAAIIMSCTDLRGYRVARITFQLMLVGYFGFVNGDMLSQALLVGWAQSGVPWRLAPGLMLLVAASLIVPAVSKKQLYCHHICPFGAAQQLIHNRVPLRFSIPWRVVALLEVIPAILIAVVLLTAMLHWPLNLAGIEPFDAFFFLEIVGVASLVIAIVGLIGSAFVPMAYCRFGCPTGALLNHLRYNARSDRLTRRDAVAVTLLLLAACIYLAS